MDELQGKYKQQAKELRDAMQQRKMAVDEFADINEKYTTLFIYYMLGRFQGMEYYEFAFGQFGFES